MPSAKGRSGIQWLRDHDNLGGKRPECELNPWPYFCIIYASEICDRGGREW